MRKLILVMMVLISIGFMRACRGMDNPETVGDSAAQKYNEHCNGCDDDSGCQDEKKPCTLGYTECMTDAQYKQYLINSDPDYCEGIACTEDTDTCCDESVES